MYTMDSFKYASNKLFNKDDTVTHNKSNFNKLSVKCSLQCRMLMLMGGKLTE